MPVMDPPVAGEQPQLQTQTVPAGGEQPQRQEPADFTSVIDGMTDATAIGDILFGNPIADAEPAGPASGDTTPQEIPDPVAELPAGEQPQEPATDPQPDPAQPTAPSLERISLKSLHPDDRVLLAQAKDMVRDGKAPRLADAIHMLTQAAAGTPEPSPTAQAQAEPASPETASAAQPTPVEAAPEVASITTRLADLRAQRKAAVEEFDRPKEMDLTSQIEDTLAELADAKALAAAESRETAVQQQTLQAVVQDIYAEYSDSEDPKSFFSYRLTQEVQDYEQAHGPISRHPSQLRILADRVSREVNGGQAATPQATPAAPPPRQVARPLGTAAPGSSGTVRPSPEMLQRLIDTADETDIRAALFGPA